jgi:hypothetical protein
VQLIKRHKIGLGNLFLIVLEVLAAFIIRAIAMMMKARTSETLVNVYQTDYTAWQPRRQPSSYSPP